MTSIALQHEDQVAQFLLGLTAQLTAVAFRFMASCPYDLGFSAEDFGQAHTEIAGKFLAEKLGGLVVSAAVMSDLQRQTRAYAVASLKNDVMRRTKREIALKKSLEADWVSGQHASTAWLSASFTPNPEESLIAKELADSIVLWSSKSANYSRAAVFLANHIGEPLTPADVRDAADVNSETSREWRRMLRGKGLKPRGES